MSDRIWVCDVCTTSGFWTGEWQWFGSINFLEERGHPEIVTCSDACRNDPKTGAMIAGAKATPGPRRPRQPKSLTTRQLLEQRIAELQSELAEMEQP